MITPGDTWAKHKTVTQWCSILAATEASIQTRCRGRWATSEPYDTAALPKVADRCTACHAAYAASELDTYAARRGDPSRSHAIHVGLRELRDAVPVAGVIDRSRYIYEGPNGAQRSRIDYSADTRLRATLAEHTDRRST